jgi:hypothetical protein
VGCSEDDSPTVVLTPPDDSLPLVSDADAGRDQLVANLELAYEQMNYGNYSKTINPSYVFHVDPAEVDIVGTDELSASEDLESTFAMFSGEVGLEPVLDSNGKLTGDTVMVPPVQTIRLDLTAESASSWTLMEGGDFAGTWRRIYQIEMTVTYSGESRVDQITGKQVFYLTPGTISMDGEEFDVWQLRAWEDMGVS